jgi:hypothetical protein
MTDLPSSNFPQTLVETIEEENHATENDNDNAIQRKKGGSTV